MTTTELQKRALTEDELYFAQDFLSKKLSDITSLEASSPGAYLKDLVNGMYKYSDMGWWEVYMLAKKELKELDEEEQIRKIQHLEAVKSMSVEDIPF